MVETFLLALFTLLIALYIQARRSARDIRRNRNEQPKTGATKLILTIEPPRTKPFGTL
jgi:hypothetical protein